MSLLELLTNPIVISVLFVIFLVLCFLFLALDGAFDGDIIGSPTEDFLLIGPSLNESNMAYFMGIKLNSWSKVIIIYAISFFSGLLSGLYSVSVETKLFMDVYSSKTIEIDHNAFTAYSVMLIDPLIKQSLYIISLFTTFTLQLQFILPNIIGRYLVDLPYILAVLSTKVFLD
jgi:hypothetical protein